MPASRRRVDGGAAAKSFGRRSPLTGRRPLVWIGAAALLLLAGNMLLGDQGLRAYLGLKSERDRLRDDVGALELQHDGLQSEVKALETDDATLERVAREKYRMRREGETVIEVVGGEDAPPPAASEGTDGDS